MWSLLIGLFILGYVLMNSAKAQLASNCTAKGCIKNMMSSCLYICDRLYLCSQKCILKFITPASNQFNSCKVYIQESNKIISVSQDSGLFRGVTRCFLKLFQLLPPVCDSQHFQRTHHGFRGGPCLQDFWTITGWSRIRVDQKIPLIHERNRHWRREGKGWYPLFWWFKG